MLRGAARRIVVGGCAVGVLAAAPAGASAAGTYVALGDSFTAGPLIAFPKGDPVDCGRSDHNYRRWSRLRSLPPRFATQAAGAPRRRT